MTETNRIEYKEKLIKDLDLVEQLGSGIPRILASYGEDCFRFTDNLLRPTIPNKSTSKLQKYYTTEDGKICLHLLELYN